VITLQHTTGCLFDKAWWDVLLLVNTVADGGAGVDCSRRGDPHGAAEAVCYLSGSIGV